jgi:hypothetical protein
MPDEEQPNLATFEAEHRGDMSNAQKRLNLFLLHRHPELTPSDVRVVEAEPGEIDDTAVAEAARRVADGEESPANFLIAARAREMLAAAAQWTTIVHEAEAISDVREIDPESGDDVT